MSPAGAGLFALASVATIVAGAVLLGGLAVGLIVGGVLGLVMSAALYDPKAKGKKESDNSQPGSAVLRRIR